ncbi:MULTISPECIES: TetR/AcrR family transcriptional regulator [Protofrankia]|uniref:Regulatory protein TetR n=1 Tax=Candidatus Protofrankia datiscae TaxID=2716812 RepID=F8AXT7_9ACTN|nr:MULTISPECIES: TetR/AcrR family transcriptional regulator [Protofrankia]AEH11505.1 regulatory protein TetR [Candidatus Protofrankia datiscae]
MAKPTSDTPAAADPALRADARRNYDLLLTAARVTFAEHGTDASLREVARRAGVGIGTLYRHFPTREALVEALMRNGFDSLRAKAEELLTSPAPGDALIIWLREMAVRSVAYHGLPASVLAALHDEGSHLYSSCHAMRAAAARLLVRAQRSAAVRPDVTAEELFVLVAAIAWAGERTSGGAELTDRLLSLMMTGLQTGLPRITDHGSRKANGSL